MRKITIIKQITVLMLMLGLYSTSKLIAQIPSDSLKAYYSINGNANDLSVNENNASVTNAILTSDRNGNDSSAYYFNGVEDYITVPHDSTLNFTTGLSVGFWMNVENTDCQIVTKGDTAGGFSIQYTSGNSLKFKLIDSTGGEISNVQNVDILNSWHFIVGTYDGISVKLYLDGSELISQIFTGDIGSLLDLTFGKEIADWSGGYFQGNLDDMFLFNRALSDDEINKIYTGKLDGNWEQLKSPYYVCGDVQIDQYTTHTIEPGVEVYFTNQYEMTVNGCLMANGYEGNEILFSATDTVGISLGSDKGWNGIEFLNTNTYSINTSELDYCTIEYISYIFVSKENRGAVYVYQSDKTEFTNCTIQNNYNLNSGGGIYFDHSEGKIENCIIRNNETNGFGGGLLLNNCAADVSISGNTIQSNTATAEGGGIYVVQGSPVLDNLTIAGNSAEYGAGACFVSTSATLRNSLINGNNQAEQNGGGVFISQGAPIFNNVTISDNEAVGSGGGIYMYKGTPTFEGTTIDSNTALNGGGLYLKNYTSTFTGANIFSNNATNFGGGIYISGGTPEISYIIINTNNADTEGDAIYNDNGTTKVINITCYKNGDGTGAELVYNAAGSMLIENSILWGNHSKIPITPSFGLTIDYSDVKGGFSGTENINSYPFFVDTVNNDFNLQWPDFPDTLDVNRSPCIDAGNHYDWFNDTLDREPDGSPRDMGVFYYHQNPIVSIWDADPLNADSNYYNFGGMKVEIEKTKIFNLRNEINAFFTCPVFFEPNTNPSTYIGFELDKDGTWYDSITKELNPTTEYDVLTRLYSEITGPADRYLRAGDPSVNSDSVVLTGEVTGNGTIKGRITAASNSQIGIEGVQVTIYRPGSNYTVETDVNGYYIKGNTGYGQPDFTVKPILQDSLSGLSHDFFPDSAFISVTDPEVHYTVNFDDNSNFTVSGTVYYNNTICVVPNVKIYVDGVLKTTTNQNGEYTIEAVAIGYHIFKAELENHTFVDNPRTLIVETPQAVNFFDEYTIPLTCSILGGCDIVLEESIPVTISLNNSCNQTVYILNIANGVDSINLPPGNYHITANVTSYGISISEDFNLTENDNIFSFIHHEPAELYYEWVNDTMQRFNNLPILYQDKIYKLKVEKHENYGGSVCIVTDDPVEIDDLISTPIIYDSIYDLDNEYYEFMAGDPETADPYQRKIILDNDVDIYVYVLGEKPGGDVYVTTSPKIPILILRDPPGDNSYSFFDTTTTYSTSYSLNTINDTLEDKLKTWMTGPDVDIAYGGVTWSIGVTTDVTRDNGDGTTVTNTANNRQVGTLTTTFNTRYETTHNGERPIGSNADIYVGAAINFYYGETDIIGFDGMQITSRTGGFMTPGEAETFFIYSEYHIKTHVIPDLQMIQDSASIQEWLDIIEYKNYINENKTKFRENLDIAGANYEQSRTIQKDSSSTFEFEMLIDTTVLKNRGLTVAGIGRIKEEITKFGFTTVDTYDTTTVSTTTSGFRIEDSYGDDDYDFELWEDEVYGTPVFVVNEASRTSCPWEIGTTPKDTCAFLQTEYQATDIPANDTVVFNLTVINRSDYTRDYELTAIDQTLSDASVFKGSINLATDPYEIEGLAANSSVSFLIKISRDPLTSPFTIENITLLLASPCEKEHTKSGEDPRLADWAYFDVSWIPPCTYLKLSEPGNDWIVNSVNQTLPVMISNYTVNDEPEYITLEYKRSETNWTTIKTWVHDSIPQNPEIIEYDWSPLGIDGIYQIRAISHCLGNTELISEILTGTVDRTQPFLVGNPIPSNGIFNLDNIGDGIKFTFNKPLNTYTVNKLTCTLWSLANDTISQIDNDVSYYNNTIELSMPEHYYYNIENTMVEARIDGITDFYGNPLLQPETNQFVMDLSPFVWNPDNFVEYYPGGVTIGDELFTSTLKNRRGETIYYLVDNLPWLSSSSNSGSLPYNGTIPMHFTASNDSNAVYIDTIRVQTWFWPDELIYVQVVIGDVAPEFYIQPQSQFANVGDGIQFEALAQGARPINYTWYKNGTLVPYDPPHIEAIDSVLIINPVDSTDFADYHCEAYNVHGTVISETVSLTEVTVNFLDLKVLLDGPFNGSDMNADLNSLVPLSQPYADTTWNYPGIESVGAMLNTNIVDWVLVELRDAVDSASATGATIIWRQACFLQKNGSIVDISGNLPSFDLTFTNSLFVVIYHRNHIGIMSANALTRAGDTFSYDFTTSANQAYGTDSQKALPNGVWGLWAADGDASGAIDIDDKNNIWLIQAGLSGYLSGDYDMNTQVANPDKNEKWVPNSGKQSNIPQ